MDANELKNKIKKIGTWSSNGKRAPHKPLLILYALGRLQSDEQRFLKYSEVKNDIKNLLIDFGSVTSVHPEYPFIFLKNDGIWELNNSINSNKFNAKELNELIGYFNDDVYKLFIQSPELIEEIAQQLLEDHFQESMFSDMISAVGLSFRFVKTRVRDSKFREKILRAYENKCAVCSFNIQLGRNLTAIEAAHIKWHKAGGADIEENGLALCVMHHKLFDVGFFTLDFENRLIVSQDANGTNGFDIWLMDFHGKIINNPISPSFVPSKLNILWHNKNAFKGKPRYLTS